MPNFELLDATHRPSHLLKYLDGQYGGNQLLVVFFPAEATEAAASVMLTTTEGAQAASVDGDGRDRDSAAFDAARLADGSKEGSSGGDNGGGRNGYICDSNRQKVASAPSRLGVSRGHGLLSAVRDHMGAIR